jgi:hypothetical protein
VSFSKPLLALVHATKIFGVRAGRQPHRFVGVWAVVVADRVFVRSWNDEPDGWYRAFVKEPIGAFQAGDREVPIRSRKVRGERLLDAIDRAYADKYVTPSARTYVRGFRLPRRRATTLELLPR